MHLAYCSIVKDFEFNPITKLLQSNYNFSRQPGQSAYSCTELLPSFSLTLYTPLALSIIQLAICVEISLNLFSILKTTLRMRNMRSRSTL